MTVSSALAPDPRTDVGPAASVHEAVKQYGSGDTAVRALDGVTLEVERSRFTAVMGPSGSGQSTLMHSLAGLDRLTSGTVRIGDTDLDDLDDDDLTRLRRDRLGFIFQAFNLLPTLTAAENITLPLSLARRSPSTGWIEEVVATLGLGDRLDHRPSEMSGGQQQRVAVARALATQPEIIFGDEPTGNLDSKAGTHLLEFLRRSVDELDQTLVIVTHDPVAASWADRAVFLADGRIVDDLPDPTPAVVLERLTNLEG
jgi:putative ABC transport system ATP-binding protein